MHTFSAPAPLKALLQKFGLLSRHALAHLPAYLQQLEMESSGKQVTLTGHSIDYQTGQIIWGQPGAS